MRHTSDGERQLHDSEERLRLALEAVDDGVWDWDLRTGLAYISPRYYEMCGFKPEEVRPDLDFFLGLVHPDDKARVIHIMESHLRGEIAESRVEYRMLTASGEQRWTLGRGRLVERAPDGQPLRMIGTISDIDPRKRFESELCESNDRLCVSLAAAPLTVFHQDRELRYTWIANPALGADEGDILGKRDDDMLEPVHAARLNAIKRRVLESGRGERHELCIAREGRGACYDLVVEPHRVAGEIVGVICAARDISEELRLRRERDSAYQALQKLSDSVQDSIETERRAIARDLHDQVGAQLTGIHLQLAALAQELPSGPLRDQALHIRDLTAATQTASRDICSQLRPPALDDLGLAETCRWYLGDWSRQTGIPSRGRFAALAAEPAEPLRTDLFRILQELLTNVARHAGAGHIAVSLTASRRGLRLRVADDGRGLSAGPSAGLGLSGIRERLRRHGGRLDLAGSAPGTVATVTIPPARP